MTNMNGKITAIVFDMDGLMVDSEPLSQQAWDAALREFGHVLDAEINGRIIGHRLDSSSRMVRDYFQLPITHAELMERKQAHMEQIWATRGIPVMPGLAELQNAIAARGIPWGVATSSPRRQAERVLAQLGLDGACTAVAGGDEVMHGKPAPDIYLLAAERMGIPPDRCLALEDSAPGCRAARDAGMRVVAIPTGATVDGDFSIADYRLASLHEVAERLDEFLRGTPANSATG